MLRLVCGLGIGIAIECSSEKVEQVYSTWQEFDHLKGLLLLGRSHMIRPLGKHTTLFLNADI